MTGEQFKVELYKANVWEESKREEGESQGILRQPKEREWHIERVWRATTLGLRNQVGLKASSMIQGWLIYY